MSLAKSFRVFSAIAALTITACLTVASSAPPIASPAIVSAMLA